MTKQTTIVVIGSLKVKGDLVLLVNFLTFVTRQTTFETSSLLSSAPGVYSKRKEFASKGCNVFPLREQLHSFEGRSLSEGRQNNFDRVAPLDCVFIHFKKTGYIKGDNFCDFLFAFLCTKPLLKRGLLSKERIWFQGGQILSF